MAFCKTTSGIKNVDSKLRFVAGEVTGTPLWRHSLNHFSIWFLSYVHPSTVETGSVMTHVEIGQTKLFGICRSFSSWVSSLLAPSKEKQRAMAAPKRCP
jgi:hypothetical protein